MSTASTTTQRWCRMKLPTATRGASEAFSDHVHSPPTCPDHTWYSCTEAGGQPITVWLTTPFTHTNTHVYNRHRNVLRTTLPRVTTTEFSQRKILNIPDGENSTTPATDAIIMWWYLSVLALSVRRGDFKPARGRDDRKWLRMALTHR